MSLRCRGVLLVAVCCGVALAVGSAQGAVSPPPGHSYGGTTSQGQIIAITLNSKRNKIARMTYGWSAPCVAGPAATPTTPTEVDAGGSSFTNLPINRLGAWRATGSAEKTDASGITAHFTERPVGRRSGGRMVGTLHVTYVETSQAGQNVRTCTSPPIRFSVAERNIFAGRTSSRHTVVIKVNPARTRMDQFQWDWDGQCTPGPAARPDTATTVFLVADFLRPIRIETHGRFRGVQTFGPQADAPTGITATWRYQFVGSLTGQLIKGTITSDYTETDTTTGGVIRTCSTGPVKFRARD